MLIFEEIKNTTIMKVVELTMTDILNETKVIRQIDLSNIFTGHKPATKENQEDLLKNWIETRGIVGNSKQINHQPPRTDVLLNHIVIRKILRGGFNVECINF